MSEKLSPQAIRCVQEIIAADAKTVDVHHMAADMLAGECGDPYGLGTLATLYATLLWFEKTQDNDAAAYNDTFDAWCTKKLMFIENAQNAISQATKLKPEDIEIRMDDRTGLPMLLMESKLFLAHAKQILEAAPWVAATSGLLSWHTKVFNLSKCLFEISNTEMAELLAEYGADAKETKLLYEAVRLPNKMAVRWLLDKGADPEDDKGVEAPPIKLARDAAQIEFAFGHGPGTRAEVRDMLEAHIAVKHALPEDWVGYLQEIDGHNPDPTPEI